MSRAVGYYWNTSSKKVENWIREQSWKAKAYPDAIVSVIRENTLLAELIGGETWPIAARKELETIPLRYGLFPTGKILYGEIAVFIVEM